MVICSRSGNHSLLGQKGTVKMRDFSRDVQSLVSSVQIAGNGGKAYSSMWSQLKRKASVVIAMGFWNGEMNAGGLQFWLVANRSTSGLQSPQGSTDLLVECPLWK